LKRSDALRIIWEAINELEDANFILKKLEDAGMLPPDNGKGYPIEIVNPSGSVGYAIMPNNTWEREDKDFDPATDKNWRERYGKD
jgi:hypothetical protein